MIGRILFAIKTGVGLLGKHPQLILTIALIVIIPIAFLVSGQQFLRVSQSNQERLEKDRIGLMQDMFVSLAIETGFNVGALQRQIDEIAEQNPDITQFRIAVRSGPAIIPVAALATNTIGVSETQPDQFRLAAVQSDETILFEHTINGDRVWQAFRAIPDADGNAVAFVFTEVSRGEIDKLFAQRVRTAYYYLIGIIIIILLLVIRHVRLIDYSYLYRETKKLNEAKDMFTNMIAHELRAPLTAIRGYASIIRENEALEQSVRKDGERIEKSSENLILIVNDLLDLARIQSGKLKVIQESVNVKDVIEGTISTLGVSAQEKNIQLKKLLPQEPVFILADSKRFQQALTNIVSNSIKYTPEGSITISVEAKGKEVNIRIADTGIGISAKDQKKLFAPFFRAESEEVDEVTGTGLGMLITKRLIEEMGGSVDVESIKGVGTHIVVRFPLQKGNT